MPDADASRRARQQGQRIAAEVLAEFSAAQGARPEALPQGEGEAELQAPPRVLVVGGSDCSGAAGIQADARVLGDFGVYVTTAITALTVQTTARVLGVTPVDPLLVEEQMLAVLEDVGADCIKIGMLASRTTVELVARVCERQARGIPIVLDPVLVSSSGEPLLEPAAHRLLAERLMPLCALITPNAPEAQALTGLVVASEGDLHQAADRFLLLGQAAVLLKGGHLTGETVLDLLRTADGLELRLEGRRQPKSPRGTGCALASALAAGLAWGHTLEHAAVRAHRYVQQRIERAVSLGAGPPCLMPARGEG